ncbi:MAG TPA: group 1 truncated hemoglobin [Streptosporangiaceae bacterium]
MSEPNGYQPSIYESIGGEEALAAVVDDLYERILADRHLAGFFAGAQMARLKGRQIEFFGQALGGPMVYTGASIRRAHQGLGIEMEHFALVAGYLGDSLRAAGVPEGTISEIIGIVAPLADDIVSSPVSAD